MTSSSDSPVPGPQPTPHPIPHPTPRPGVRRPAPHPAATPAPNDPHRFGRIDDDGTVWLLTAAGERRIGAWQAGDTETAFAHFGRRFDDLSTEVSLLEERLASGSSDARKIKAAATALIESLPTAAVLGDVDALADRLRAVCRSADAAVEQEQSRRAEHRAAAVARKEALAVEAEDLAANSTQWKAAGDRLRAILDEWKRITGLDRKTDDLLWKRYSTARDAFSRRRGAHFAELDRERATARQEKERLCRRAEELATSTDWAATSASFRDLLGAWKAAGRAPKEVDDALWHRFKTAQDIFFSARNSASAERDAALEANAAAKEALLAEAERLDPEHRDTALAAFRSIVMKWDAIGKVPRQRTADLERRLRAVEKRLRDTAEPAGADPQAQARAEQFRARAEQFAQRAGKAEAAGREKEAAEARESARQWQQWADAAERALTRKP